MEEQYWVGDYFIDLTRNQLTQRQQSQTLPPKALAVLTCLAKRKGNVVSQDELLATVWPNTVVSPNTLQRCIAQLRKALGDDGKVQHYIKTHAKQGYSLEADVQWQTSPLPGAEQAPEPSIHNAQTDSVSKPEAKIATESDANVSVANKPEQVKVKQVKAKQRQYVGLAVFVTLLFIVAFIGYQQIDSTGKNSLVIKAIKPLTSTDNRELASVYSPDGQYVIFQRFPEVLCTSHLWAKNLNTQQEFQLSDQLGAYGNLAFSADGNTLAYVQQDSCGQPVTQKSCFKLQSIDFQQALKAPQTPNTIMECNNSEIRSVKWLNNDDITLLQKHEQRWQLIRYSMTDHSSETIFSLADGNIFAYDYSASQNLIALTSIHSDGSRNIETLTPQGQLLGSYPITYPDSIPKYRPIYANFSSVDNQLVFSTGKQLYTLSYQGDIQPVSLPLVDAIGSPVFHPDGTRMLAIKGHYDSDIIAVPLSQFDANTAEKNQPTSINYQVIARSTFGEDQPKFRPSVNGNSSADTKAAIAYSSRRSGSSQLWLTDNATTRLSDFTLGSYIYNFAWAEDGASLLVNVSSELKQVYLDGRSVDANLSYPVTKLFHWHSNQHTVLAMVMINGVEKFAEIDLTSAEIRIINHKRVTWAQYSDNGQLIYMDHMDRIWQPKGIEDQLIAPLIGQGSDKRFVIKNNIIYGINDDFQLWSYGLENQQFALIAQLPDTVDDITDANQHTLLMTMRVAARKDVVELSLK
ncbi:winged helix-turn-helix domain-containing protein [Shewanella waksmanii]|uniref:winged helix-turn-helix domain-containing protein n=1 Tax=Shewanella waksmanii TaxID=213783 RepID=UPI003735E256